MDAIVIVCLSLGLVVALCCLWARMDYLEKKRRQITGGRVDVTQAIPLPSIPIEPLEFVDYRVIPEAAHLPTWTPTVSHYPDQDHGPETTSQHDFDAIGDNGSHDDGCCDGGDDGSG